LKPRHLLLILAGFLAVLPPIQDARSCSVPVFRYALERWKPDPYKGIYIYRNEISGRDRELLQQLKDAASNAEAPLNLLIREVDAASFPEEKLKELLQGPVPDRLPVLVIWYPGQMGKKQPVWSERLTPTLVGEILQSPKRRQMAESLIKGASVVWVFIPSGNREKDRSAETLLRRELDKAMEGFLKAPFSVLSGGARRQLSYGFPVLTLSRKDPAERIFIDTLLKSESDLVEYPGEPMVFPVFGRGRVLGCLFGEYITEKAVRDATAFLAGACSCEVKDLNPGIDLLVAAPWDIVVMNAFVEDTPLPELTGVMPTKAATEEPPAAVKSAAGIPAGESGRKRKPGILKIYGITLGSTLAAVVFAGILINRRRKKNS
jgi:hypothetical protein